MRPSNRFIVALVVASIVTFSGALLAAASAFAQQVGTATAVNPLSESTPPGGTTAPLVVGAHIVHKERVHTTPAGTAQLLFTDKSTMSIAPNTDIVIDEYVYDPNANSGHMLVSLTKGALRFVGGQLSHQGEARSRRRPPISASAAAPSPSSRARTASRSSTSLASSRSSTAPARFFSRGPTSAR